MYKFINLPLLDKMTKEFDMDLSDVTLVTSHHILESNYSLMNYLFSKWLKGGNIFCISKAYSTDKDVLKKYIASWIHLSGYELIEIIPDNYLEFYTKKVEEFILSIREILNSAKKIIIWDDWWRIIECLSRSYPHLAHKIFTIEHTTSWFQYVKNIALFPIINIARNTLKLDRESYYIALSCFESIIKETNNLGLSIKKCLIIWKGAIGSRLGDIFSENNIEISFYDKNPLISDIKDLDNLSSYDCIVGATWTNLVQDMWFFNRTKIWTVFCSTSSWDYEFNASLIRKQLSQASSIHSNLEINWRYLLNNGFPVNFQWHWEPEWIYNMQITRALVYWAMWQLMNESLTNWLTELSTNITEYLN